MTSAGRLYALLTAVVVFFLSWATVAAHPWQKVAVDPQVAALQQRRVALRHESLRVKRVLDRRWAAYRVALARHRRLEARYAAQALAQQRAQQRQAPAVYIASSGAALASAPAPPAPVIVAQPAASTSHTS